MPTKFIAEENVSHELAAELMTLSPADPFCTASYAAARYAQGDRGFLLGIQRDGQLLSGCYGFLTATRLSRVLDLDSLPDGCKDEDTDTFWRGLLGFCAQQKIAELRMNPVFPVAIRIPVFPGQSASDGPGDDFLMDLANPDWERKLRRRHRQSIRLAVQHGVVLRRTPLGSTGIQEVVREHIQLRVMSMERQNRVGDAATIDPERAFIYTTRMIEHGAGELFDAVADGETLSSALILRAAEGAYYCSSGSSSRGMKCGASQFVVYTAAQALRTESTRIFSLGPAVSDTGLWLFKDGFGGDRVHVERAEIYLGSGVRRKLVDLLRNIRSRLSG